MNIRRLTLLVLTSFGSTSVFAQDSFEQVFQQLEPQQINYKLVESKNIDWIKVENNITDNQFSWSINTNEILNDEIGVAWKFTNFLTVSFNVFENKYTTDTIPTNLNDSYVSNKFTKYTPEQQPSNAINRRLSGYKFGLSSQLGLGNDYKLGINFDYGQLDGAEIVGFNSQEINTTSFELGIRNNKFGASVNTDIFTDETTYDVMQNSRLGIELDWFFSEDTTFSVGSKQRINDSTGQANYLESLTGNVQYIKFQHNL